MRCSRCCTPRRSAVAEALGALGDWGLAGTRDWQYRSDLAADAAAVEVLDGAGLGVMSEESGSASDWTAHWWW